MVLATFASSASAADRFDRGREPHLGHVLYDLGALRPLDTAVFLTGAVFFVPLYPISLVLGGSDDVVDTCIEGPFDRAFRRPLGRL
jgi:hypothetical protein